METFNFHLMPYQDVQSEAWPFPEDTWDPDQGARYYQQYLEQLEYSDAVGFDGIAVNEHHFSAYGLQPSPNITAANLAARTEQADIAFFGNIPTIRENPIRLAEELAMLDNISEGRIISGFPRGIPAEYLAYGIDLDDSRPRFEEAWELIVKAWTAEEPFDWDGEFFQYENVYIWPRPYQQPHPRLWMPAESEKSVRFAAERQVPMGSSFTTQDEVADTFDLYRQVATEEYGWEPGDEHFTILAPIYVADSIEQAREEVADHLAYFQRKLFAGVHLGVAAHMAGDGQYDPAKREEYIANLHPHGKTTLNWTFDEAIDDPGFLVGEPATIVEKLEHLYESSGGIGRVVGHFCPGDIPHDRAMRNIERYADEVKPQVDAIGDVNP